MAITPAKLIRWTLSILAVVLVVAQFVPVDRSNPPVDPSLSLNARLNPPAGVRSVLDRSCRDCHSNETTWPWYSRVAPVSWLVASDVKEGRSHLNLSEWGSLNERRAGNKLQEICEEITSGAMPDWKYLLVHPEARLSKQDVDGVCAWTNGLRPAASGEGR